jgi:anaerobic selenocysteine-containing dehydrogenase
MRHVLTTACPLDCPDTCSLAVTVDDGRIIAVDADTSDNASPFTQGFICQKVKHHAKRVYAPERVLTPLIRTGPKGSGEFSPASWEQAERLIADRLSRAIAEHGVNSVIPYLYTSSGGVLANSALAPILFERLGCPDVQHTICASTVGASWNQVFGSMLSADPFDLQHSDVVVIWGANPIASNTHLVPLLTAATKRGAKLIVIDPRRTAIAARADLHLAIRPGTDVVLAYAAARWLNQHGKVDRQFLADHTVGADEFLRQAEAWPLQRAAEECGVSVEDIEVFASTIATDAPAMMRLGYGLERNRNGGSGCVGALSLWLLAGNFGRLGSGVIGSTSSGAPLSPKGLWPEGVIRNEQPQVSMNDVGLALDGRLTGWPRTQLLFVQGANPAVTAMDQTTMLRGLARDDLFTVVHDQVLTDTAVYADVVLPATTHFEVSDIANSYGSYSMQTVTPVIDRVGESRSNDEVAAGIARAMGFPADDFNADPARLMALMRTDSSVSSLPTRRVAEATVQFVHTFPGFGDDSTRARLADATSPLPVPEFKPASGTGLTLLTPATNRTINSMFAEFAPPDAVLCIHPFDASNRGVRDGERVRVFNELGELAVVARVDAGMRRGVVSIPKGLWRRHFDNALTANVLIPHGVNDLGEGACFNDAIVEVQRIA